MQDRYGNRLTTSSKRAHQLYCEGVDLFLAAQPGGVESLTQATKEDPGFAIAHADLARALQIVAQPKEARTAIEQAQAVATGLGEQEAAHVAIMSALLGGKSSAAYGMIEQHAQRFPRDVMAVAPACGVFGLIGFSGRTGREAENLAFMQSLAADYAGDWWFDSQFAFALCEVGQLDRAEKLIDSAFDANPENANAVHHRAHVRYEMGESTAGRDELASWRSHYDRSALLHCHLAWHDALWNLSLGDVGRMWAILEEDVHPDYAQAPPINVATDLIALLLRAELAGQPRSDALWQRASDYVLQYFSRPGISFVDMHTAVAVAITGRVEPLRTLAHVASGTAADLVRAVAEGFAAFGQQDWAGVVASLAPVMPVHERLGGSRAQRDLLELTFAYALSRQGLDAEAERFAVTRRGVLVR